MTIAEVRIYPRGVEMDRPFSKPIPILYAWATSIEKLKYILVRFLKNFLTNTEKYQGKGSNKCQCSFNYLSKIIIL